MFRRARSKLTTDIHYVNGVDNASADALTRIISVISSLIDYAAIAAIPGECRLEDEEDPTSRGQRPLLR